ncbi:Transcriptional regulator, contains XRE-family HTH domain [Amycolatopsis arida]|uniref:Transcriptional regulator, contains XRE-family HTH domain n=1 Tax=Amycolatopsis arida TaxID=587909 RepID=A0A1I5X0T5_9PSEU|nr:helix-turn-helix transcriptional regulator [Amycolatopsis arida]TDX92546.1 transcriptional regulator with XRE-family HTH domain [Amycolatopsis arida]SFQ25548.1 Transcriptional regulator, contains XRE-family HTH domain [Amycolatopsis arida]
MDDRTNLGARIRQLRGKLMTQQQLADAAQVDVSLIRKLEQGLRHTASIGSLQRIARALDVTVADLLGKPAALPTARSDAGVVAVRRALTPVDDLVDLPVDDEPLTLDEAERSVGYLWGAYWAGRYELLSELLPTALPRLRATYREAPAERRSQAAYALARGYQAAGDTLVHLGHLDAAWLALREALRMARSGDDPLLYAALRVSVAWQLLVQGRYAESERVCTVAAGEVEPHGAADDSRLAVYGLLAITGATAAARARKGAAAADLLDVAGETADRLGYERSDHQSTFGPAKVAMLAVDVHVVQDNFPDALSAAERLPRDAALPVATRARHLADLALAHLRLGQHDKALNTVLTAEQLAPDWIKYQSLPRQIVAELVETERRVSTPLRDLALRLGVTASA